jgi:dephospho-CoA kinase
MTVTLPPQTAGEGVEPTAGATETTLLVLRPHPGFIVLRPLGMLAGAVALAAIAVWLSQVFSAPTAGRAAVVAGAAFIGLVFVWHAAVWRMHRYVLTTRRLIRTSGVLRRLTVEIPLERVQHIALSRSLRERISGLGTLAFSTAGSAWVEMVWLMVDRPDVHLVSARAAIDHARDQTGAAPGPPRARVSAAAATRPAGGLPVIGLAGGIGAGKTEVARTLESLGCHVIDSDQQARMALQRPEVRDQLQRWWGRTILAADGTVDRREVARIVFNDDQERLRLEGIIHPLLRARRADLINEAQRRGARAVVIDAPLLFEAAVDQECDAVIFVDVPRDVRLNRLRESRGWDEAELKRRERAQMPLEEKRRRSQHIIKNIGDQAELSRRVAEVLRAITG